MQCHFSCEGIFKARLSDAIVIACVCNADESQQKNGRFQAEEKAFFKKFNTMLRAEEQ